MQNAPSPETLRPIVNLCTVELLKKAKAALSTLPSGHMPLDLDVFTQDNSNTKKEGVSWTYRKLHGFAPITAWLGLEGWCLEIEQRPGSQHAQQVVSMLGLCQRMGLDRKRRWILKNPRRRDSKKMAIYMLSIAKTYCVDRQYPKIYPETFVEDIQTHIFEPYSQSSKSWPSVLIGINILVLPLLSHRISNPNFV